MNIKLFFSYLFTILDNIYLNNFHKKKERKVGIFSLWENVKSLHFTVWLYARVSLPIKQYQTILFTFHDIPCDLHYGYIVNYEKGNRDHLSDIQNVT